MEKKTIPVKITREIEAEASIEEMIDFALKDPDALRTLLLGLWHRICIIHSAYSEEFSEIAVESMSSLNLSEAHQIEEFGRFLIRQAIIVDAIHRGELIRSTDRVEKMK